MSTGDRQKGQSGQCCQNFSYIKPKGHRGLIFPGTERKVNVIFAESSVRADTC